MPKLFNISTIITSILSIILGIIIIANPSKTMAFFAILFSITIIIVGIATLYNAFIIRYQYSKSKIIYYIIEGIISIVLGIMLLSSYDALKNFIPLLIGFWIALKGVTSIVSALEMKKFNNPRWNIFLFVGIIFLIFAFLIAAFPIIISVYLSLIIGIFLIITGVLLLLYIYYINR